MGRNTNRPLREGVSMTLPPEKAARLRAEADEGLVAPSKIIEGALDRYWAAKDADAAEAPSGG